MSLHQLVTAVLCRKKNRMFFVGNIVIVRWKCISSLKSKYSEWPL